MRLITSKFVRIGCTCIFGIQLVLKISVFLKILGHFAITILDYD